MTISPTQAPGVAYTPTSEVSVVDERDPSSHVITVMHPADTEHPLLGEGSIAPANSEVVLNEEKPPSEIPIEQTQSIFNRIFCCCKK